MQKELDRAARASEGQLPSAGELAVDPGDSRSDSTPASSSTSVVSARTSDVSDDF